MEELLPLEQEVQRETRQLQQENESLQRAMHAELARRGQTGQQQQQQGQQQGQQEGASRRGGGRGRGRCEV